MALTPAAFIYPPDGTGELRPAWFEEGELAAALPVWIDAGTAIVPEGASEPQADAVVLAYVYVTAYEAKAKQIAGTPDSVALDGLSRTTSTSRAKFFLDSAAEWEEKLGTAVAEATPPAEPVAVAVAYRPSGSVERVQAW